MIRRPPRSTLFPSRRSSDLVVVVHDWYGQLPHVRALCDDLASAGFTALAVDLYDGATAADEAEAEDRKSTRLNSSHANISYAVFCLKKNTHGYTDRASACTH